MSVKGAVIGQHERIPLPDLLKKFSVVIMLLTLLLINAVITRNFFSIDIVWLIIMQCATIILTGMGQTLVISTGGIDISIGSLIALAAVVCANLLPYGIPVAMIAAVAACSFMGLISGFMVGKLKVSPMVVTLSMLLFARILYIDKYTNFEFLGQGKIFGELPMQIIPIVIVVALVYFIIEKTAWGRRIQAVGDNPTAARLAGINATGTIISAYVLSAAFAAVAGLVLVSKTGAADGSNMGRLAELDAIAAVAVGGTSMAGGRAKVIGTLLGAIVMQLITITVVMNNIQYEYAQIIKSAIIIFAVFIQRESRS
jgi:ribose/xylose/arabinose/galactoside ABC-type transport system permease subunit